MVEQYSRCGLTKDLYRVVNAAGFLYFIVLLIRPSIRLALEYMSLQCAADFRSVVNVTPRSFSLYPLLQLAHLPYYNYNPSYLFHSALPYILTR